jgi:heavy metal sensor kinase
LNQLVDSLDRTIFFLILPALFIAGLSGAFLTDRSLRPVRQISKATSELAATNLSLRLPVKGKDEFSELAGNFNRMTERLEEAFGSLETAYANLESAYQQQKRFTADASHELRTPLTAIKANTSLALSGRGSLESYREALEEADAAASDMNRIVEDLLFLARSDNSGLRLNVKAFPIGDVIESAVEDVEAKRAGTPIRIILPEPELKITGDPHHLKRLLTNLLENAVRHTPVEGSVTVSAEPSDSAVILKVEDTGEGIPAEHLPHIFDRFYRVDEARSREDGGAGLGLSICQSIVQAHAGTIEIESRPGEGTVVTVVLPHEDSSQPLPLLRETSLRDL